MEDEHQLQSDSEKIEENSEEAQNQMAEGTSEEGPVTPEPQLNEADKVREELEKFYAEYSLNLRRKENLKLDWVDYQFDEAYYSSWDREACKLFSKAVQIKARYNRLK